MFADWGNLKVFGQFHLKQSCATTFLGAGSMFPEESTLVSMTFLGFFWDTAGVAKVQRFLVVFRINLDDRIPFGFHAGLTSPHRPVSFSRDEAGQTDEIRLLRVITRPGGLDIDGPETLERTPANDSLLSGEEIPSLSSFPFFSYALMPATSQPATSQLLRIGRKTADACFDRPSRLCKIESTCQCEQVR